MSERRAGVRVRHFRQILLWPLQLMPVREGSQIQEPLGICSRSQATISRGARSGTSSAAIPRNSRSGTTASS